MANISAKISWGGVSYKGVHVGSIQVNLSSVLVDQTVHFFNLGVVNTGGRGESDHNTSQVFAVSFDFGLKIVEINLSFDNIDRNHL